MNQGTVDNIARAVLYEGYLLYPYRRSTKSQHRWTFGGVFPQAYADATVKGHETAIQQFKDASRTLPDPALKKYAKEELKIIRRYYEKAQKLQSKFAGRESSAVVADRVTAAEGLGER